jgi:hypothetical protein
MKLSSKSLSSLSPNSKKIHKNFRKSANSETAGDKLGLSSLKKKFEKNAKDVAGCCN